MYTVFLLNIITLHRVSLKMSIYKSCKSSMSKNIKKKNRMNCQVTKRTQVKGISHSPSSYFSS